MGPSVSVQDAVSNHSLKMDLGNNTICGNISHADTAFVIINSAILLLTIPGFSFYYAGQTHPGSSVTMLLLPCFSMAIVSIQWWFIGHSLAFSKTASLFIGDFTNMFLQGVYNCPYTNTPKIPDLAFSIYQSISAMIPPAILLGAIAERGRIIPALIFISLWTTFVYDFVCCWTLNPRGWSYRIGSLDYGGASPVHVPAGMAALAYSIHLGPPARRRRYAQNPYTANQLVLGTVLIWLGTVGNVSGTAMSVIQQTISACSAVTFSTSSGAITWSILEYLTSRKLTLGSFCSGVRASLIAITSCAGYISPSSSVLVGIVTATVCVLTSKVKEKYNYSDVLDVFVLHAVGGFVGSVLTGILSQKFYGGELLLGNGGWLERNWIQVPLQLAAVIAAGLWSFIISYFILFVFSKIPFLKIRTTAEIELTGLDESESNETSFEHEIFQLLKDKRDAQLELTLVEKTRNYRNLNENIELCTVSF